MRRPQCREMKHNAVYDSFKALSLFIREADHLLRDNIRKQAQIFRSYIIHTHYFLVFLIVRHQISENVRLFYKPRQIENDIFFLRIYCHVKDIHFDHVLKKMRAER